MQKPPATPGGFYIFGQQRSFTQSPNEARSSRTVIHSNDRREGLSTCAKDSVMESETTVLQDVKVAVLLAKMHEESELWYPVRRLKEAGATVVIVAEEAGKKYKGKHGLPARSDKAFAQIKPDSYDGVVIPGGFGPDYLRHSKACLRLVKELFEIGKMVAFICHAGWVPISAGILKGKRATSVPNIKDDMINAGCRWEDNALVVDQNLISSRDPDDLPNFMTGIIKYLVKGTRQECGA